MNTRAKQIFKTLAKYSSIVLLSLACGYYFGRFQPTFFFPTSISPFHAAMSDSLKQETVMVVGGSAAHGWADPNDDSYVQRAFQSLTDTTNTEYTYVDRTVVGDGAANINDKTFSLWLSESHPQVVVISWGLLNDINDRTSSSSLDKAIHDEVSLALKMHAVVLFVTPPVVEATVSNQPFNHYIADESSVVQSFRSHDVYWINLYQDMYLYLQAHGLDLSNYAGGTWHPNEAGHELAGELLFNELVHTFGSDPISFKDQSHLVLKVNSNVDNQKIKVLSSDDNPHK